MHSEQYAVDATTGRASEPEAPDPIPLRAVQVLPVTAHGWRVSDERRPRGHPFRLLAYVERRGASYEVMQVGAGLEWHEFPSLRAAIEFVVATGPVLIRDRRRAGAADLARMR